MSLLRRSLVLVAVSLAPAVGIQLYNEITLREARIEAAHNDAREHAELLASDLRLTVGNVEQLLVTLAQVEAIRAARKPECDELLRTIVGRERKFINLASAHADGRLACTAVPPRGANPNLRNRPYFRAFDENRFIVGEYTRGLSIDTPVLQLGQPLHDAQGEPVGVVWAAFRLAALHDYFAARALPRDAELFIADRNGTILVSVPDRGRVGDTRPAAHADRLQGAGSRSAALDGLDGQARIYGLVPEAVAEQGLSVGVGLSRAAALEEVNRASAVGLLLLLGGIVSALLTAILGSRLFLQQPIAQLLATARRWRMGDYGARANLSGHSEIAQLGGAFDAMAEAVAQREQALTEARQRAEQRAEQAEKAEQQKLLMLKEVNHRVKNSLQLVSSLLSLQMREREGDEAEALAAASSRVATIARVHHRLYQTDDVQRVEFSQYLHDLCADIGQAMGSRGRTLTCRVQAERIELPTDIVVPLSLVMNELITNAFKYAYPGRSGVLQIDCRRAGDNRLRVVVADEGVGMPQELRRGGLGMRLVEALTQQLEADLRIEAADPGTRFVLSVPLSTRAVAA